MNGEEAVIRASEPGQRGSLLRLSLRLPAGLLELLSPAG